MEKPGLDVANSAWHPTILGRSDPAETVFDHHNLGNPVRFFSLQPRESAREYPMRTFINRSTKINVFGIGQDRDVVTVRGARGVHAAQHLAMWHATQRHASRLRHGLYEALLALKQSLTAAPAMPALCPVPAAGTPRSAESMRQSPRSVNG
jgi:hypothetical protein